MNRFLGSTMLLGVCAVTPSTARAQVPDTLPPGWLKTGATPDDYTATIDRVVHHSGQASGRLSSRVPTAVGFGTLTQRVRADSLRGRRLLVSAWLRTRDATAALLFVRVDGPGVRLDFANTADDPATGTAEWTQRILVVDVPDDAVGVTFGLTFEGTGTVWIDDVVLGAVPPDTPRTGVAPTREAPSADGAKMLRERYATEPARPRNLGFEELP